MLEQLMNKKFSLFLVLVGVICVSFVQIGKMNPKKISWEELYSNADESVKSISKNNEWMEEAGKLYRKKCKLCHGKELEGGIGPNLTDDYWLYGGSSAEMALIIGKGTENGMKGYEDKLTGAEGAAIIAFIQSKKGSKPEGAKAPEGEKE